MEDFLVGMKIGYLELARDLKHLLLSFSEKAPLKSMIVREIHGLEQMIRAIDIALADGGFEDMLSAFDYILEGIDYWIPKLPEESVPYKWQWRANVISSRERVIAAIQIESEHEDILRKMNLRDKPKRVTLN